MDPNILAQHLAQQGQALQQLMQQMAQAQQAPAAVYAPGRGDRS
jgi:hypothetical protein